MYIFGKYINKTCRCLLRFENTAQYIVVDCPSQLTWFDICQYFMTKATNMKNTAENIAKYIVSKYYVILYCVFSTVCKYLFIFIDIVCIYIYIVYMYNMYIVQKMFVWADTVCWTGGQTSCGWKHYKPQATVRLRPAKILYLVCLMYTLCNVRVLCTCKMYIFQGTPSSLSTRHVSP